MELLSKCLINNITTSLIICVDSDNDYLLEGKTQISNKILTNEYIFHTYTYSIENYRCFSDSLHSLCVQSTKNDNKKIDLTKILELYSLIIFDLFLWFLYFLYNEDFSSFPQHQFTNLIKLTDKVDISDQANSSLLNLKIRVEQKLLELKNLYPNYIKAVEESALRLEPLGLTQHNTYLFIQGHTLLNNVILILLKPLCESLKKEKINEIKSNYLHETELTNELNHYNNQLVKIETVIKLNTAFNNCIFYAKIIDDLKSYIDKIV